MTRASPTSTAENVELSDPAVYLTAAEIAAIEDDPVLTVLDVLAYRAGGEE